MTKKELFDEFPEFKEKRANFSYDMTYHRTKEELQRELKKVTQEKVEVTSILLWIYKEM